MQTLMSLTQGSKQYLLDSGDLSIFEWAQNVWAKSKLNSEIVERLVR